ncbi:predicted protein [Sclerotinia sclerotiorum 1980 UF-70]|uniref:Uncharacterized protein n=1 Tax=Sclerotinia sclerotiorum (strain ATCC 18683 / 1980 / Ss-1) TaxID=665079 RepID=A7EUU4_SCLS1|nr:predicted protein [Sclerotinia sclerotiorum 1980 UF-70]EDN93236.1 predicted protein [Sclerotinia sclerotiorum 1980 UF-70]
MQPDAPSQPLSLKTKQDRTNYTPQATYEWCSMRSSNPKSRVNPCADKKRGCGKRLPSKYKVKRFSTKRRTLKSNENSKLPTYFD